MTEEVRLNTTGAFQTLQEGLAQLESIRKRKVELEELILNHISR